MSTDAISKIESADRAVAIYHVIYEHEGFDVAAQALFRLVQQAQTTCPGKKRKVFLDINGHRDIQGGFDAEMVELQRGFLCRFLIPFVSDCTF